MAADPAASPASKKSGLSVRNHQAIGPALLAGGRVSTFCVSIDFE
jgi:hypothetical protein